MAKKRLGNQNPTQSVILPYTESLSDEAIAIYEKTGLKSYPWQKNLVKSIMAVDDDGLWVHQKFGFSIPRRNGKTEIIYILELWGLQHGLNMLHTAHRISTSHSSFEKVKKYLEKMGIPFVQKARNALNCMRRAELSSSVRGHPMADLVKDLIFSSSMKRRSIRPNRNRHSSTR